MDLVVDFGAWTVHVRVVSDDGNSVSTLRDVKGQSDYFTSSIFIEESGNISIGAEADWRRDMNSGSYYRDLKDDLFTTHTLPGINLRPLDLYARFLSALRIEGEKQYGTPIRSATIIIPHDYGEDRRARLTEACHSAGFESVIFIQEALAAIISYEQKFGNIPQGKLILLYDLGANRFITSLVEKTKDDAIIHAIRPPLNLAGGVIFDMLLKNEVLQRTSDDTNKALEHVHTPTRSANLRLFSRYCTTAKHQLSIFNQVVIPIALAGMSQADFLLFTRDEFSRLIEPEIRRTTEECHLLLREFQRQDILGILMVGGSVHIPHVRWMVQRELNLPLLNLHTDVERTFVEGAALDRSKKLKDQLLNTKSYRLTSEKNYNINQRY